MDEYQDVDETQYRLIKLLAGLGHGAGPEDHDVAEGESRRVQIRLCVIGDDDQNIYAFRRASNRFLLQFEKEYSAQRLLLTENYRSTEPIIQAANRLIAHNTDRCKRDAHEQVRIDQARSDLASQPVQAWHFGDIAAQAAWIRDRVRDWLAQGAKPGEIAILALRWDRLGPARLLLEQGGVATQALNRGAVRLVRNLTTCLLLEALLSRPGTLLGPAETVEGRILDFFRKKQGRSEAEPTVAALLRIGQDIDRERGLGREGGMLPITAEEIAEAIHEFDAANETHRDDRAVLATSCHGAKGLEFSKVILLTDGFDPSGEDWSRAETPESAWAEKRRLFYVAMTRAKEELVLLGCIRPGRLLKETAVPIQTAPTASAALPKMLIYQDLTPAHVNLGHPATRASQELIKGLREGDSLQLGVNAARDWLVRTEQGRIIGALSRRAKQELDRNKMGAGSFTFGAGEVRVGRIYHHLKFDDITGEKVEDWFVAIPLLRVCR